MSIVLPRRKKKKDFFVPRKSLQEVKDVIGPAYFDSTLLECSKNAVELTKLIHLFEDIDKERTRVIREIDRQERILMRSVKHTFASSGRSKKESQHQKNIDLLETKQGIETLDGKLVTPGFRYTSCGDIKPSSISLPLCQLDSDSDTDTDKNKYIAEWENTFSSDTNRASHPTIRVTNMDSGNRVSDYESIDYDEEIKNLQIVIDDMCRELEKSKLNLNDKVLTQSESKLRPFLRSHTTDYRSPDNYLTFLQIPDRHNFLHKRSSHSKHSKGDLYRRAVSTPSHRSCVGCQFRIKQQSDELNKIRKVDEAKNVLKRKWSYVPHGKYVQSSTVLTSSKALDSSSTSIPSTSIRSFHRKKSSHAAPSGDDAYDNIDARGRQSVVHFKTQTDADKEDVTKIKVRHRTHVKSASDICYRERPSTTCSSNTRTKSAQTGSTNGGPEIELRVGLSLDSAISGRSSGRTASRNVSRMLIDYDSRLMFLKELQVEHEKLCDMRVKSFLTTLQPAKKQH